MRIFAMTLVALLACSSTSSAGIVIDFTSANNPLTNVNDFSPGTNSTTQLGDIGNTPTQVSVVSDLNMVAQGQTLNPASGSELFSSTGSLTISFPNVVGVRDFSQNLDFAGNGNSSSSDNGVGVEDITVTVDFTDPMGNNPSQSSASLDFEPSGSDRYDITTTMNEIITQVTVQWINGANVSSSKQIRINAGTVVTAVPEPSSFVFLGLLGMACVGWKRLQPTPAS